MISRVYEALSPVGRAALVDERDRLDLRLAALREERAERESALAEVDEKISHCVAAMDALSGILGVDQRLEIRTPAPDAPQFKAPGDSIIETVSAVFSERGNKPLHYRELAHLVAERGIVLGGKDSAGTLLSILTNARYADRFERCARGTYRPVDIEARTPPTKLRKSRRRRRVRRSST